MSPAARQSGQAGVDLLAVRYPTTSFCVDSRGTEVGVIEVITSFPRSRTVLGVVRLLLLGTFIAALLVGVLVGGPLIGRLLSPLCRMTRASQRIASGDLSYRVGLPERTDEIGHSPTRSMRWLNVSSTPSPRNRRPRSACACSSPTPRMSYARL